MFIAAYSQQPRNSNNLNVHQQVTCTVEYYPALKKETVPHAATWMQQEIVTLMKQITERGEHRTTSLVYALKQGTNGPVYEAETGPQTWRRLVSQGGREGGLGVWG